MNKVIQRLERLERRSTAIDAINRKYEMGGVRSLTDEELLIICAYNSKTSGIDYSALSDDELKRMIADLSPSGE